MADVHEFYYGTADDIAIDSITSEETSFEKEYMLDNIKSNVWKSTSNAQQTIIIDRNESSTPTTGVFLYNVNFSSFATVKRVSFSADNVTYGSTTDLTFSGTTAYYTGAINRYIKIEIYESALSFYSIGVLDIPENKFTTGTASKNIIYPFDREQRDFFIELSNGRGGIRRKYQESIIVWGGRLLNIEQTLYDNLNILKKEAYFTFIPNIHSYTTPIYGFINFTRTQGVRNGIYTGNIEVQEVN